MGNLMMDTTCLASAPSTSDEEWEREDPNLLDNPELLFAECETLPPPDAIHRENNEEFWESVKVFRELVLNHNFVPDILSKREEFRGRKDTARNVLETMINVFESDYQSNVESIQVASARAWTGTVKKDIFSGATADRIQKWKVALNSFLESYLKIRDYIPKEPEDNEEQQQIDEEKEMCKYLPIIVEELQEFLDSIKLETDSV